jgi:hypothetical protein
VKSNATLTAWILQIRTLTPNPIPHTQKNIPKEWDRSTSPTVCSLSGLTLKDKKSGKVKAQVSYAAEDHVWFEDRWIVAPLCDE